MQVSVAIGPDLMSWDSRPDGTQALLRAAFGGGCC